MKRCRHRKTWLIGMCSLGGYEWCYECGAMRELALGAIGGIVAITQWTRPTGVGGKNPWPMKPVR